jgi:hypothetical protein
VFDSAVMAKLIYEAIGEQLRCIFVDHGLLRKNEPDYLQGRLKESLGFPIEYHNFSNNFLSRLNGVTDPVEKRSIIGEQFIRSFESAVLAGGDFKFLAQGTLYPDVIESGGVWGTADVIKSHHNVGGLPEDMEFELIEPLRELFKDEVREVGKELGLPPDVLGRHPFPGPGSSTHQQFSQILDLPFTFHHFVDAFIHRGDTRRVIPPVFQTFQPFNKDRDGIFVTDISDDSTHGLTYQNYSVIPTQWCWAAWNSHHTPHDSPPLQN